MHVNAQTYSMHTPNIHQEHREERLLQWGGALNACVVMTLRVLATVRRAGVSRPTCSAPRQCGRCGEPHGGTRRAGAASLGPLTRRNDSPRPERRAHPGAGCSGFVTGGQGRGPGVRPWVSVVRRRRGVSRSSKNGRSLALETT